MITVKKETTIAGLSELRNKSELILKELKNHRVILEKHNHPVAVMVDYQQYAHEELMLDYAEEYILGMLAVKRDKESKPSDFVDIRKW
jgi:PHD/YefM family antitoxin component YafN of YafNO toxin-antitoxin module